ncbi:hypothetical protein MVEN_02521700 [Mycena venus]|uniref:Uncharacterized protein n=1 Tax=Mycena venus TaxID=2733690 RepID=A0A8H6WUN0_9AGAR|nr:hypothetical protein MVEN_02521700 [Mycena venus]
MNRNGLTVWLTTDNNSDALIHGVPDVVVHEGTSIVTTSIVVRSGPVQRFQVNFEYGGPPVSALVGVYLPANTDGSGSVRAATHHINGAELRNQKVITEGRWFEGKPRRWIKVHYRPVAAAPKNADTERLEETPTVVFNFNFVELKKIKQEEVAGVAVAGPSRVMNDLDAKLREAVLIEAKRNALQELTNRMNGPC